MAPFRASPEFKELQEEALRGGEDIGSGFRRDLKLISEVQAPFRGVRRFFYVAFIAAAGISTFFTIPRLIFALQGGDGAPDFLETAGNAAINIGGCCQPSQSRHQTYMKISKTKSIEIL
uniref:Uncharacterized protein n=1 Tax=Aegilops tauschii subsp. strangulata TaxID=200361 RepID=A0A453E921_AEGTS